MAKIRGPLEIDTVIGLGQWTLGDLSIDIVNMENAGLESPTNIIALF